MSCTQLTGMCFVGAVLNGPCRQISNCTRDPTLNSAPPPPNTRGHEIRGLEVKSCIHISGVRFYGAAEQSENEILSMDLIRFWGFVRMIMI